MYRMYIADSAGEVLFPVTPPKLSIQIENKNKTLTLVNEGEVNLIKTPGLSEIAIDDLILPAMQKYPFAMYEGGFKRADFYLGRLEKWKKSKKPVQFTLLRTSPDGSRLLWDTNMAVTVEKYEVIEDVKQGLDVKVKLELKEYREWGAKKLVIRKTSTTNLVDKRGNTRSTKESAKSYTVKEGDSLYLIAKKQLNDGGKWKQIYDLNKKTIESAAREHGRKSSSNGYWIWPGTRLRLPG